MKDPNKVFKGRTSRRKGIQFEHKTIQYLQSLGYHTTRWNNIINLSTNPPTLQQANNNRFHTNTGFPDLLAFKPIPNTYPTTYTVILIECKTNNTLTKQEKLQLNHYQYTLNIPSYIAYPDPTTNNPTLRQHTKYTPNTHKTPKTPISNPKLPPPHKTPTEKLL